jgi:hypothetical protein
MYTEWDIAGDVWTMLWLSAESHEINKIAEL